MNWHTAKKLKRTVRRMSALLLATLSLTNSAFALSDGGNALTLTDNGFSLTLTDNGVALNPGVSAWDLLKEQAKAMSQNPPEKSEAEIVAALQPGDSYIGKEYMYVCYEETYVDWTRIYSKQDLQNWNDEERLLLIASTDDGVVYTGNDYANSYDDLNGKDKQIALRSHFPDRKQRVLSGITRDTAGAGTPEYVEEYIHPELAEFYANREGDSFPYPDTFRTVGTMNAPYIEYAGTDVDNGNHKKYKIIMSKDDGTKSAVALSHDDSGDRLQLKAVNQANGFTFYMEDGEIKIFENIDGDDDLYLIMAPVLRWLYGGSFDSMEDYDEKVKDYAKFVLYVGVKSVERRIEVTSLELEDAEQNPEALENVYGGAIEFYHWEKVTSSSQLPTDNGTYRAMLVWDDEYFLQGDDFRKHSNNDGMALYVNEEKTTGGVVHGNIAEVPEIDLNQNEFYTMGGMGTPYIYFRGRDDNKSNDNCPMYAFQLAGLDDRPAEKWLCDGDNVLDIRWDEGDSDYGGMNVGIIVGQEADSGNDAAPGKVKLFYNETGWGRDTDFMYSGNVFYGDDCGWNGSQFTMYIGKPVVYPAVRQNYVVGEDQFMHISQNGAMLKNVTITVAKGGVLSIESWFMNNGRIVVDGGTLIVQNASNPLGDEMGDDTEDSVMLPFADIHPSVSGSLELKNGGELIVLTNTRAVFSNIKASSGSSILNNGLLLTETLSLQDSTLENQKGMTMFVGYDFREIQALRKSAVSMIISDLTSRLNSGTTCMTLDGHSAVRNDGSIRYSTGCTPEVGDPAWNKGSGSYTQVRGKESRYMLTQ